MAKQTSVFTLQGKLDGVTFYKRMGKNLAKRSGGVSKTILLTSPKFQRTRENISEFGGAATTGRALRIAIAAASKNVADPLLTPRLTKIFKLISDKDTTGIRGQRSFLVSANQSMLQDIELNDKVHLNSVFKAPFTVAHNAPRNEGTLTVPALTQLCILQRRQELHISESSCA